MKCPRCKGDSTVIDSRTNDTYVRRRRKCLNKSCKFRWTTREESINDRQRMIYEFMEIRDRLKELIKFT